jgi:hypothetical protein
VLVCKYGLGYRHPAVAAAVAFLSSFQTEAGDYRGIYRRQYTPNYSAAITEVLLQAGYEGSPQVEKTMRWLLTMRQGDGGWAIPARTLGLSLQVMLTASETFEPDRNDRAGGHFGPMCVCLTDRASRIRPGPPCGWFHPGALPCGKLGRSAPARGGHLASNL